MIHFSSEFLATLLGHENDWTNFGFSLCRFLHLDKLDVSCLKCSVVINTVSNIYSSTSQVSLLKRQTKHKAEETPL